MLKNLQLDVLLVCPVAASITVGKNELRVHNDGLSKVLYSQLETVETGMGQAPVVVGEGELRVDTDSLVQVFNRRLIPSQGRDLKIRGERGRRFPGRLLVSYAGATGRSLNIAPMLSN